MELESFVTGGGEHLATKHHVDEPKSTDPTQTFGSKVAMHDVSRESPGTDSSGHTLMENRETRGGEPGTSQLEAMVQ